MFPHLAAAPMTAFSEVTGIGNRTGLDLLIYCKIAVQLAIEASKMVMTTLGRGNRTGQRAPPSITLGTGNQTGYGRMHKFALLSYLILVFLVRMSSAPCEAHVQTWNCGYSFPKDTDRVVATLSAQCKKVSFFIGGQAGSHCIPGW